MIAHHRRLSAPARYMQSALPVSYRPFGPCIRFHFFWIGFKYSILTPKKVPYSVFLIVSFCMFASPRGLQVGMISFTVIISIYVWNRDLRLTLIFSQQCSSLLSLRPVSPLIPFCFSLASRKSTRGKGMLKLYFPNNFLPVPSFPSWFGHCRTKLGDIPANRKLLKSYADGFWHTKEGSGSAELFINPYFWNSMACGKSNHPVW